MDRNLWAPLYWPFLLLLILVSFSCRRFLILSFGTWIWFFFLSILHHLFGSKPFISRVRTQNQKIGKFIFDFVFHCYSSSSSSRRHRRHSLLLLFFFFSRLCFSFHSPFIRIVRLCNRKYGIKRNEGKKEFNRKSWECYGSIMNYYFTRVV